MENKSETSAMPFIFEGDLDLGAIGLDLAVRDHQVLLDHLGHAQIRKFAAARSTAALAASTLGSCPISSMTL